MIRVTLLNNAQMVINADLVEAIEAAPDTIITLTTGRKIIARDSVEDVVRRAMAYQRAVRGDTGQTSQ